VRFELKKRFYIFWEEWAWIAEADDRFPGRLPASVLFARSEIRPVQLLVAKEATPDCRTKIEVGNALTGK
jgi:hypothetical protein